MKIGIDIEEISRFQDKTLENSYPFLERIFTQRELQYCFSFAHPAEHLCARFCAKEALIKATCDKKIPLNKIEIINNDKGCPRINIIDYYYNVEAEVSLSHCKNYATAVVLLLKEEK